MAISEACKFEIEESVDKACQEHGISNKEAFRSLETFYNKIGIVIKFNAIRSKYYRAKDSKKDVANATPHKPMRKHTKPETKKQLSDVADIRSIDRSYQHILFKV